MIAPLRERFKRRYAKSADSGAVSVALEDRVFKTESSLSTIALTEEMICSKFVTLQTDLSAARANQTRARLSAVLADSKLNTMRTENEQLKFRVFDLSFTTGGMRLQQVTVQSPISSVALKLLPTEHDQYLGHHRSLIGEFEPSNNDFTNVLANARDSRLALCCGVDLLFDESLVPVDEEDISENAPVPPSTV